MEVLTTSRLSSAGNLPCKQKQTSNMNRRRGQQQTARHLLRRSRSVATIRWGCLGWWACGEQRGESSTGSSLDSSSSNSSSSGSSSRECLVVYASKLCVADRHTCTRCMHACGLRSHGLCASPHSGSSSFAGGHAVKRWPAQHQTKSSEQPCTVGFVGSHALLSAC